MSRKNSSLSRKNSSLDRKNSSLDRPGARYNPQSEAEKVLLGALGTLGK